MLQFILLREYFQRYNSEIGYSYKQNSIGEQLLYVCTFLK